MQGSISWVLRQHEDDAGREFADALGGLGKTSRRFWDGLRAAGIDVRCYNPPRLDSPFGWVSREHGKMLPVDG